MPEIHLNKLSTYSENKDTGAQFETPNGNPDREKPCLPPNKLDASAVKDKRSADFSGRLNGIPINEQHNCDLNISKQILN